VGAITALVVASGAPAYADKHVTVTPDGPNAAGITGTSGSSQATPGNGGSSGTGYTGTGYIGTGSSSSGGSGSAATSGGTTAVPHTCGSYQGSTFVQYACPDEPAAEPEPGRPPARPQVTTEMVVQAARVTAPANPPHVEPGTVSYVNIPNNYWTESPVVRDSVTVVGQTIPLVWTPTGTSWDFGDGAGATGDGVEGADVGAPGAIEHSYARQGSYDISTSTTYNLSFVVPGQGAQTISLTAPPSPPVTLPVREIQTLVDFTR
jgi:hypothetical protein